MRVLYLAPWFPYPLDTGARIRVYHLLRGLAEQHRVTLLTLDPQGWAPARLQEIAPFCEHVAIVRQDPFQRKRLRRATRFLSMQPIVAEPFPELMDMVQELHAAQAFDIVIAGIFVMAPYALALPGVTHVLEEHNSHSRWMYERYLAQTSAVGRLRCLVSWRKAVYYESRTFPQFDLVTMVSEMDAEASRALLPSGKPPIKVFPNGVDCNELRPGRRQPDPDRLIFSGSLTYRANYDAMIYFLTEVFDRIQAQRPAVQLRITGLTKGVDLGRLPLTDAVTLTGYVEDIHAEVAGAAVSIVPILSGGGTRLKVLEAMALGTPVVSTTKGAEGIDAIHGEHLLLADDPDSFAAASLAVLSDPELRQRLVRNAWRLVEERYDWTKIGREFASAVTEVSARRTGERTV